MQVKGMTCSNCALSVTKYLQKEGYSEVKVSPIDGSVSFASDAEVSFPVIKKGIQSLGYEVVDETLANTQKSKGFLINNKQRFLFCLPFTAILLLHMFHNVLPLHFLMNPWVQLALCLPVFIVGMYFFGRSAIKSLKNGIPNMDVLIALGALAAFVYSLTGAIKGLGDDYLFFETTATIITLVFMGNYLEQRSVDATQTALQSLVKSQKVMANMIAFDDKHEEQVFPVENTQLKNGDLVLIKTGEQVPADCKILWGDCRVNEAILTGESVPVPKTKKDKIIGGSVLESGLVKAQVEAAGKDTVLSAIIKMVQDAQSEKPPMQKLADKISAVFVPLVIGIAMLTYFVSVYGFNILPGEALMRSIAVLVISCPCAMGLATPAAIAVGLGRSAKKGILFRNATSLENFKNIKQVVFDKTGTLTTGKFTIQNFETTVNEDEFKNIVYSMEKFSSHPIASAIAENWKTKSPSRWKKIEEVKGKGMQAEDVEGNIYLLGSAAFLPEKSTEVQHNIYLLKNNKVLGWIDAGDELRPEAKSVVKWFHEQGIRTILLTGDREEKAASVAAAMGIDDYFAGVTPAGKLQKITELNTITPTAMIGDGINDAPALAKATIGISLSEASQLAMQTADVVLVNSGLQHLPLAMGMGKHTNITIKQNLFWAFAYNVVAIPIAALGFLTPAFAALAMGLSDVVLGVNSVRLFVKKVI